MYVAVSTGEIGEVVTGLRFGPGVFVVEVHGIVSAVSLMAGSWGVVDAG